MFKDEHTDTIAAISTAVGTSGIGIVRISGRGALSVADKIFISKDRETPSSFKTYTTHYGWIINPFSMRESQNRKITGAQAEIIDEVILTVMRAPKSYTKEDIVEINCHGGIVALRAVLDLVLESGCRLAQPGEFTKRAFLNGRIDLAQAEAVLDVIQAKTDSALRLGVNQLKGALSSQINSIRDSLLEILSLLEANIDFPEEEIGSVNINEVSEKLSNMHKKLQSVLSGAKSGRLLREGVNVVICGKPNAGKSSLLNTLLKEERSIVTPIPGTTRDTIEEIIDIKGIPIKIIDTAGIIEPKDLAEKKAVARSRRYINLADIVILLFDGSKRLNKEDEVLIRALKRKNVIAVINKMDLKQRIKRQSILKRFNRPIDISAKKAQNIGLLEDAIVGLLYSGAVNISAEPVFVANLRHIEALRKAEKFIAEALNSLDNKLSFEYIAEGLKNSLLYLDDILGRRFHEDLLDRIFAEFCIGK